MEKRKIYIHKTIPVKVWADIDIGIVALVKQLNKMSGVRTQASCQGTIGEGGAEPYRGYVMVSWSNDKVKKRLQKMFELVIEGSNYGYVFKNYPPPHY